MFLAQSIITWIPDSVLIGAAVLLAFDKILSLFKSRGIDLPLLATTISEMSEAVHGLNEGIIKLNTLANEQAEFNKTTYAKYDDGSYRWTNSVIVQKQKDTDNEINALKLQVNEVHCVCTLIKERVCEN